MIALGEALFGWQADDHPPKLPVPSDFANVATPSNL
jgi:hypothetical protein